MDTFGGGTGEALDPRIMTKSEIALAVTSVFDRYTELGLSSVRKQDRNKVIAMVISLLNFILTPYSCVLSFSPKS